MSLASRKQKISQTMNTVTEVYRRNKLHRVYGVTSPTSQQHYQVLTDWSVADDVLTIKCNLYTFTHKEQPHPANHSKYICCQFLAVAKWAAKQAGKVLSVCESYQAAKRLLRFGGQLVRVVNLSGAVVWATVR